MPMPMSGGVKIVCKQCNRQADASLFVLDPVFKRTVCPECVKDRKKDVSMSMRRAAEMKARQEAAAAAPVAPPKPAGWDDDDAELERLARQKKDVAKPKYVQIDDSHVKYGCEKCGFKFKHNFINHTPSSCPYCGNKVANVRL